MGLFLSFLLAFQFAFDLETVIDDDEEEEEDDDDNNNNLESCRTDATKAPSSNCQSCQLQPHRQ